MAAYIAFGIEPNIYSAQCYDWRGHASDGEDACTRDREAENRGRVVMSEEEEKTEKEENLLGACARNNRRLASGADIAAMLISFLA